MNFIHNQETYKIGVRCVGTLAANYIPFLWCRHDNVRFSNLSLGQLAIACELIDNNAIRLQTRAELIRLLSNKRFHRCHIHNLARGQVHGPGLFVAPFTKLSQDR